MKSWVISAAALLALGTAPAFAGPLEQGQFSGAISAGVELPVDGDVHLGASAPVASLAALNPNLPAAAATLDIGARSFDDIYGELTIIAVEGAYGLGNGREVFGALKSAEADAGGVQVGTATVPALGGAVLPVQGRFGAFEQLGVEVGLRQYFGGADSAIKPYVAGRVGVARVEEIRASFTVPVPNGVGTEPNDIVLSNVAFFDDSTVWTIGADIGVSFDVSERFSLSAEAGIRYNSDLDGNDSAIGGLGLARINDTGERWSAPILIRGALKF
jgi:hypothetical protein